MTDNNTIKCDNTYNLYNHYNYYNYNYNWYVGETTDDKLYVNHDLRVTTDDNQHNTNYYWTSNYITLHDQIILNDRKKRKLDESFCECFGIKLTSKLKRILNKKHSERTDNEKEIIRKIMNKKEEKPKIILPKIL